MDVSNIILESLTTNDEYVVAALPYLKEEYFEDQYQRYTFNVISEYIEKHHSRPDQDVILIEVEKVKGLSDDDYESIVELTNSWKDKPSNKDLGWLVEQSEEWCKNRAFYLAVKKATLSLDESKSKDRGDLPELMRDALGVSFDTQIGHDFFDDWEDRWQYYTDEKEKIPFDLDLLNKMTDGGVEKKTLNIIMGGIHSGKTRLLCHLAAAYASAGMNVVYFTMEMAEQKIAHRVDANLLGVQLDHFKKMSKDNYKTAVDNCRKKTKGDVIVKEFPTASAHAGHFRHVIRELKQKKDFEIDVIIVDYINICASARAKQNSDSYSYVNMIAQELRGLGQEFNVPVWSATQVNRAAFSSSDLDLDDVAESFGLPAIADWLGAIISDETLLQLQQVVIKQLKSRYSDKNLLPKGILNYDNTLMRMTDAPQSSGGVPQQQTPAPSVPGPQSKGKRDFSNLKI